MNVCVVVDYPSRSVVHVAGYGLTVHPDLFDVIKQSMMQARQIGQLRRPVVHLSIDVDSVLGAPCRLVVFVPDALEVRGKGAWSGRRYQEISSVAKL